jgi:hypothetical protein
VFHGAMRACAADKIGVLVKFGNRCVHRGNYRKLRLRLGPKKLAQHHTIFMSEIESSSCSSWLAR